MVFSWQLRKELLAARRGLLSIPPAQSVRVATHSSGHQGSQYIAAGKEGILVQWRVGKSPVLPAYLLINRLGIDI
jgi:hypothetical protein